MSDVWRVAWRSYGAREERDDYESEAIAMAEAEALARRGVTAIVYPIEVEDQ